MVNLKPNSGEGFATVQPASLLSPRKNLQVVTLRYAGFDSRR